MTEPPELPNPEGCQLTGVTVLPQLASAASSVAEQQNPVSEKPARSGNI